jgi:glutamate/tyrosine decarboxylase-like PLP-dependent enzyme
LQAGFRIPDRRIRGLCIIRIVADRHLHQPIAGLLREASERATRYLEALPARKVAPTREAVDGLARFDTPFAERGTPAEQVIRELDEIGSPATMAMAGGRFFGFVIGGALPATVAASWLATAWDQNTGLYDVTPATAELERIALRWLIELFGLPAGTGAGFVTGATVANMSCLAAARHAVLAKTGWDVEAKGLFGAPEITVVVGEEVHPTVVKALGVIGLGRDRVVKVPVDRNGRVRADAFPRVESPAIVVLQAGNVNTGDFDPFEEIVPKAHEAGAWVHVDGAFGLWALASPKLSYLAEGIQQADSWATDAHKWLNVPYDSGLAFCRDGEALRRAMGVRAAYLPPGELRDPSDFTPELSRRARGVEVWAALRHLGRSGLAEMIERCCRHARRFSQVLQMAGYKILNDVRLNQVLVSFGSPEKTARVIAAIQEDGTCWAGPTVWQGRTAMRISVSSWATTDKDVDSSLEAMLVAARSK